MSLTRLQNTRSIYKKSLVFLYVNNYKVEIKTENKIYNSSNNIKYFGVNLIKDVQDLYIEKYKTLLTEILKDLNKSRNIPCSWIGRLNIVRMSILLKSVYRLNTILIKISVGFL